jgi:AcrR family transcriptional regulator
MATKPGSANKEKSGSAGPRRRRAPAEPEASAENADPAPTDSPGRPYHHGNLREELIRCGKARLKEEGSSNLSLRRIAADAGVSQVAPTHHFGNKEGLLAAIAARGFRDLTEFRYSRLRPSMNAEQRLRVLLTSYVQFATLNPALFHLMFAPQFKTPDAHADLIDSASQSYQLLVRAAADYIKESAKPSDTAADDAARLGWICMHGLATLMIEHRINPIGAPRYNREQLLNRTVDQVFGAIRSM